VSRMVSFVVLLGILVVIGIVFFRVMANFFIPLFAAVLLVIMFGPLRDWYQEKCKGRIHLAALATTATILLIVLLPTALVLWQATLEGKAIYRRIANADVDASEGVERLAEAGNRIGLSFDPAEIERAVLEKAQQMLAPAAYEAVQFLAVTVLGVFVMTVSLYYFLAEGPSMVRTMMRLSPLDDKYEELLIDRFAELSRAMVVATLAAAVTQGLLAGIGYYFAGVGAVFLLMVLTTLLAMVPFVGAAAVWAPVSVWLFFHDGRTVAAVLLAIYGAAVVSMSDNLIKPLILHGRARLHPLLALLSVLGGVQALGPIGVFIGPMAVALLQTVLNLVQTELAEIEGDVVEHSKKKAEAATR